MPDVPISAQDRRLRLRREAEASRAEARALAESFDDSTGLSWFWALLFGPLYYIVHGFYARAWWFCCSIWWASALSCRPSWPTRPGASAPSTGPR